MRADAPAPAAYGRVVADTNVLLSAALSPHGAPAQLVSRDPTDDAFVHAALAAGALRLVSGDADLLCLHPLGDLHLISPRAALDEWGAASPA